MGFLASYSAAKEWCASKGSAPVSRPRPARRTPNLTLIPIASTVNLRNVNKLCSSIRYAVQQPVSRPLFQCVKCDPSIARFGDTNGFERPPDGRCGKPGDRHQLAQQQ